MSLATESWLVCLSTFIVKGRWFHSVQSIPSLIGEKPGVKRNHFQKDFEKFFLPPVCSPNSIIRSNCARPKKYGDNARLVCATLKNCKNARWRQNNANHRTTSKILRSDLGTCWRSKCPAPPCQRHRQIVVHVSDKRIPSFSQVYYGRNLKKQANGMTVPFQKTWHRPPDILRATICRSKLCGYWYHPLP